MSLLDTNDGNMNLEGLNESELRVVIAEKKKDIKKLNKEIEDLGIEIKETDKEYQLQLADLNSRQQEYLVKLEKQRQKLAKDLSKLEKQQQQLKDSYESHANTLNAKIEAEKEKKKKLMKSKTEMDVASFEKKKDAIDRKLQQLRNTKKEAETAFNEKMLAIKQEYESLSAVNTRQKSDIEDQIDDLNVESSRRLNDLNNDLLEVERLRNQTMKELEDAEDRKLAEIQRKKDQKLQARVDEYNAVESQYQALVRTRDECVKNIDDTNLKNERQYSDVVAKYERERDRIVADSNRLNNEIEEANRTIEDNKIAYADSIAQLENELTLFSAKEEELEDVKAQMEDVQPGLVKKFQTFVDELQNRFNEVRNKNEEDLKALEFNLSQEEERLASRNDYLNERFEKRQALYKKNIENAENVISGLNRNFADLKDDYEKKTEELNHEIEDAKSESERVIEETRVQYADRLRATEKDYAERIERVNEEIAAAKDNIDHVNKEIEDLHVEIEVNDRDYRSKLNDLNNEQTDSLQKLDKQRQKLVGDLERLQDQQNKLRLSYEAEAEGINGRIEAEKEKKRQSNRTRIDMNVASFDEKKDAIDRRLEQLRTTKKEEEDTFKDKMLTIKNDYESHVAANTKQKSDIKDMIDELNETSTRVLGELNENLAEIERQRVQDLKELEDAENEKIAELQRQKEQVIQAKVEEYNSVDTQYKSLIKTRDDFLKDIDATNSRNEKEYNEAISRFENERDRIIIDNEKLNSDIDLTKKTIDENKITYAENIKKLENELELYSAEKEEEVSRIREKIGEIEPALNSQYQKFVDQLESKFAEVKKKNDDDLQALEFNLSQEEKRLGSRNDYLNERFAKRQALYQKNIEDDEMVIAGLMHDLDSLKEDYQKKTGELNENIENAKNESERIIADTKQEYAEKLKATENEYAAKLEKINSEIGSVKENIGQINKEIAKAQKDSEDYHNDYLQRKLNLDREHMVYLKDVEDKHADLQKRLDALKQKKDRNDEIYQNNISDLQAQKNELVSRYEDKLTQIQNEYDNQVSSLNQKYNDDLEEAKNEHERRLEEINNKYEQNVSGANNRFAQAQARYEGAKDELSVDIDRLTSESQQKIANLHAHMDELNDSIAKMKVEIEAEEANNVMQIQSLEKERDEKIQEIVRQHEEAVARIVEEYETVPTAQLQQIRDEYTLKQVEYNENAADISSRKHKIDEEEADAIRKNALQKEVIENKYTSTNNEYLRYKKEVEDTEVQLNDDYLKRQAQLEDYKEELASQIEVVRQQKQQELEAVEKKNNEELENKKLRFKANEEVVEKQYEDKINSYRENLQVKQNNLNSLMTEIDLRRKNVEQQNTEKYNEAIEQTKSIQKKLDDMLDANDIKRSELSNALIQKKEMIESELNEVSTSYNNILEEKRQAYNQLNSDIREKCESLRSEIANLEQRKALEISRMQTYEEEKKYLMDERKNETVDHVNNISKQIENIVKQTRELEKAHKDRVVFLKEQIASTMTEYDDLLRIKPSLIEDVDKEYENDLVKMTKEFRDTLDELEVTHKQILEQLATKRDEAIENINKEIENLDLTRTNRLKEFEDEVRKISSAYDVMLKDEHDKQNILNDHIAKAMSEQEKFIQNMHNQDLTAVTEYEKEKQRLADIHEENLKNSLDDFNQSSDNYKKEIEKLLFTKSELDNELSALLEKNRIIDEEIVEEELKLKYQCNTILFEARKLLEQRQNEKKKELNKLDIMKG